MSDLKVVEFPKKKKQPIWWVKYDMDLFVGYAVLALDFGMWQKNFWAGMSIFMFFCCIERIILRLGILKIETMDIGDRKP